MWLWKCPKCGDKIDFDYDDETIRTDEEMLELFDYEDNSYVIKGEMWCTKCHKRYLFEEHWKITLDKFTTTEIDY